ncbi:MAG: hypothetical protein O7G84_00925 [Gammaproteobacteria bacterium]|nr:hypothetical protein [Gammaproteobacteria bacterium]
MSVFERQLAALTPEDRQAVADGLTYRVAHPGGRVEYARDLQHAIDIRQCKLGEQQAQITALPWERKPAEEGVPNG